MTPIALASLGAGRDAALDAAGVAGRHVYQGPPLLVAAGRVTGATADLRLYRRDSRLGRWVPSSVPKTTVDPAVDGGVFELRFVSAGIKGEYAIVQEAGAGVVDYYLYEGRA